MRDWCGYNEKISKKTPSKRDKKKTVEGKERLVVRPILERFVCNPRSQ